MREAGEISHQKINEKIGPPRGGKLNRALETLTAMVNVAGEVPVDGSVEESRTLRAA